MRKVAIAWLMLRIWEVAPFRARGGSEKSKKEERDKAQPEKKRRGKKGREAFSVPMFPTLKRWNSLVLAVPSPRRSFNLPLNRPGTREHWEQARHRAFHRVIPELQPGVP